MPSLTRLCSFQSDPKKTMDTTKIIGENECEGWRKKNWIGKAFRQQYKFDTWERRGRKL